MIENKNKIGLKLGLGVLLALLLGSAYFCYNLYNKNTSLYNKNKENVAQLTQEKESVLSNLNQIKAKYDIALSENDVANENLLAARARVQNLIDSLKISETNVKNFRSYIYKYKSLQKEMKSVLEENDKLKVENQLLTTTLDSTNLQLEERKIFLDSLKMQNTNLVNVIGSASVLNIAKLKAEGVIVRSSGRIIETEKARRSDKLRICYTVTKNALIESGNKAFFVQVIDPDNNVLGENKKIIFNDQTLNYSLISTFSYKSKDLDICEFIQKNTKDDFEKGNYKVNLFEKDRLVSSSIFVLD